MPHALRSVCVAAVLSLISPLGFVGSAVAGASVNSVPRHGAAHHGAPHRPTIVVARPTHPADHRRLAATFRPIPLPHPGGRSIYNPGDPFAPLPHAKRRASHKGHGYGYGYGYDGPAAVGAPAPTVDEPLPRRVKPRSVVVLDPRIVVSRTPSGRIFIGHPVGPYGFDQQKAAPYAPPEIHIIGAASNRHMRGPIHLTHGVKPGSGMAMAPKVVWLKQPPRGQGPLKSAE
jgi:hypothetical protein